MGDHLILIGLGLIAASILASFVRVLLGLRRAASLGVQIGFCELCRIQFKEQVDPGAVVDALVTAKGRGARVSMPDLLAALRAGADPRMAAENLPVGTAPVPIEDEIADVEDARRRLPIVDAALRDLDLRLRHARSLSGRAILGLGILSLVGGVFLLAWLVPPLSRYLPRSLDRENLTWGTALLLLGVACIAVSKAFTSATARSRNAAAEVERERLRRLRVRCAEMLGGDAQGSRSGDEGSRM